MTADPQLEPFALVPAFRGAVEDPVVAHQELDTSTRCLIGLVYGSLVEDEGAEAKGFGQITGDVCAGLVCVAGGNCRHAGLYLRRQPLPRLLNAARKTEVKVEVALGGRRPVEAPAHALAEGGQRLNWRTRYADHVRVASPKVWEHSIDAVGDRRAGWTPRLVAWAKHKVVDDELRAAIEQVRQSPPAVRGLQRVNLLDRYPRKLPTLTGELIAQPGVFLFPGKKCFA